MEEYILVNCKLEFTDSRNPKFIFIQRSTNINTRRTTNLKDFVSLGSHRNGNVEDKYYRRFGKPGAQPTLGD